MHGLRVLIVEDEYLVAVDMEQTLQAAGVANVTTVRDAAAAVASSLSSFDIAIIEANFGSESSVELCTALQAAGVAVVVTSADLAVQALFTGAVPLQNLFDSTPSNRHCYVHLLASARICSGIPNRTPRPMATTKCRR